MDPDRAIVPLVPRRAAASVREALADTRVVAINGPRQCGKSTLAEVVAAAHPGALIRTLDDADMRELAHADPRTFVEHDDLLVIDEIQRVPDLLLAIKARVDRNDAPGQFLLTGSSDLRASTRLKDTLPGRMEVVDLWPFSQGELAGAPDGLLDAAISGALDLGAVDGEAFERIDYLEMVARGGFPEAVRREGRRRTAFHRSWLESAISREARELAQAARPEALATLVDLLAADTAGYVVVDRLSRELEIAASTVRRYLSALEQSFVISTLPAWHSSRTSRSVKMRKALLTDSGAATSLLGASPSMLAQPGAPIAGALVETFAIMELVKQASWSDHAPRLHHFRTKDGIEVDLVAEVGTHTIVGFEIKAAASVRDSDFRGLRHLRARLGDRFRAGIVLHTGPTATAWGDQLWALPLSAIWTTQPGRP